MFKGGDFIYAGINLVYRIWSRAQQNSKKANKLVLRWGINQFNLDFSTNKTTRNVVFLIQIYIPSGIFNEHTVAKC